MIGFIGGTSEQPMPITEKEANAILRRVEEGVEKPKPKVLFEPGEMVRVIDGPFNDFNGRGGERELRQEPPAGRGADLRAVDPGRAGLRAGGEGLNNRGAARRLHPGVRNDGKKVTGYIKLQIPAGEANPSPPVGPALGQQGVNIMEFCKQFNAATQKQEKGLPIPVIITVYSDRTFTFVLKTPPAAVLVRKAIGIEKGSGTPNTEKVGKITRKQLEEIAKQKMPDLTASDLDAAVRTIAGSARSMGVDVEGI